MYVLYYYNVLYNVKLWYSLVLLLSPLLSFFVCVFITFNTSLNGHGGEFSPAIHIVLFVSIRMQFTLILVEVTLQEKNSQQHLR